MLHARVNYGDPGHHKLEKDIYSSVEERLTKKVEFDWCFPVKGSGEVDVIYEYIEFEHAPTTLEVLKEIKRRRNVRFPDFAETCEFHAQNPNERKVNPIISICGPVSHLEDDWYIASGIVQADWCGLHLYVRHIDVPEANGRWWWGRFLVVRK